MSQEDAEMAGGLNVVPIHPDTQRNGMLHRAVESYSTPFTVWGRAPGVDRFVQLYSFDAASLRL